jgi:hypothetical protein
VQDANDVHHVRPELCRQQSTANGESTSSRVPAFPGAPAMRERQQRLGRWWIAAVRHRLECLSEPDDQV